MTGQILFSLVAVDAVLLITGWVVGTKTIYTHRHITFKIANAIFYIGLIILAIIFIDLIIKVS